MKQEYLKNTIKDFAIKYDKKPMQKAVLEIPARMDPYMRLLLMKVNEDQMDCTALLAGKYYLGDCVKRDLDKAEILLNPAIEAGNVLAKWQMGMICFAKKEYLRTIEFFQDCVEEKEALSPTKLGVCYSEMGESYLRIPSPDYTKAVECMSIALVNYQNHVAGFQLGNLFSDNTAPVHDPLRAKSFYERAAAVGSELAANELARRYAFGGDVAMEILGSKKMALELLEPFKESNEPQTLLTLGRIHLMHDANISENYQEAEAFLKKALFHNGGYFRDGFIEQFLGYAISMNHHNKEGLDYLILADSHGYGAYSAIIGNAYYQGNIDGIEKDDEKAAVYYERAYQEKNLNPFQCDSYATLLMEGNESVRDYRKAYEVSEYGLNEFQYIDFAFKVGKLVLTGKVNNKLSMYEAVQMIEAAISSEYMAEQSHVLLGNYYIESKDYRSAEYHFLAAFEKGNAAAGLRLARLYERGAGSIAADVRKAVEGYQKAADAGSAEAKKELSCFVEKIFGGYQRVKNL